MFQRIFRHTKHEAYHADYKAFPESREAKESKEVGGERGCLHFQIVLEFQKYILSNSVYHEKGILNGNCREKLFGWGFSLYLMSKALLWGNISQLSC